MLAEQLASLVIALGDFWLMVSIIAVVAMIAMAMFILAKRIKPTEETPAAFADFIKTCLDAIDDSQLTSAEKLAIAEKGTQFLSTFTTEK